MSQHSTSTSSEFSNKNSITNATNDIENDNIETVDIGIEKIKLAVSRKEANHKESENSAWYNDTNETDIDGIMLKHPEFSPSKKQKQSRLDPIAPMLESLHKPVRLQLRHLACRTLYNALKIEHQRRMLVSLNKSNDYIPVPLRFKFNQQDQSFKALDESCDKIMKEYKDR